MPKEKTEAAPQPEKQTVVIKLNKYKSVVDALGNPRTALRVSFTIFFIGVLLFAGITIITLAVKRLYPYSDITTNGLGATTIKSEKTEVSYWLFNTATVWADSGIYVKEGDILTIRASGKSNTAIHHLYNSASENKERKDDWVGSEGEPDRIEGSANYYRRRFRVFPNMDSGALLMQVAQGNEYFDTPREGNQENFYFVGRERQNIVINNPGTLRFAVNDIVLNRVTIARMMWDSIIKKGHEKPFTEGVNSQIIKTSQQYQYHYTLADSTRVMQAIWDSKDGDHKQQTLLNMVATLFDKVFDTEIQKDTLPIGIMGLGRTVIPTTPKNTVQCELSYYFGQDIDANNRRKYVWFEDNIGSFLIIVEKSN